MLEIFLILNLIFSRTSLWGVVAKNVQSTVHNLKKISISWNCNKKLKAYKFIGGKLFSSFNLNLATLNLKKWKLILSPKKNNCRTKPEKKKEKKRLIAYEIFFSFFFSVHPRILPKRLTILTLHIIEVSRRGVLWKKAISNFLI